MSLNPAKCRLVPKEVLLSKLVTRIIAIGVALVFGGVALAAVMFMVVSSDLPKLITVEDYKPLLVSEIYSRDGVKIGEYFRERRKLVPYQDIPKQVVQAFVAAEDDSFFEHGGINYTAIFRAVLANIRAGRKVQGGSTITQQVAKSLLLTPEKTYTRKIKEALLAYRMEENLSKEEILYLYLNQIYFGQGCYGVAFAAESYFNKPLKDLDLSEIAILAGLPQAPSRFSPIYNPQKAKERQLYVLGRMAAVGSITEEEAKKAGQKPLKIYTRRDYKKIAPFYLETLRGLLVQKLGEEMVLDKGLKIYTGIDYKKQVVAREEVYRGLREVDKRQGYRGPLEHIQDPKKALELLSATRNELVESKIEFKIVLPDGTVKQHGPMDFSRISKTPRASEEPQRKPLGTLPDYVDVGEITRGIVTEVNDAWGFVAVQFAEAQGLIDFESMKWARKPNPNVRYDQDQISNPSEALKVGDVVLVKVVEKVFSSSRINEELSKLKQRDPKNFETPKDLPPLNQYVGLELEQEPVVEGALISFDQKTEEIIAMVGGFDFDRSEFNRTIQAIRQTGSAFKPIVYASALDHNYTAATPIMDAPIVYEEEQTQIDEYGETEDVVKKWKPLNHSKKFSGDILFRNALIRSMNVPTVKIIEDIGIDWVAQYARRLGIFSPLNLDFTLALGSSGITVYEVTKVFAQFGRMGRRIRPKLIHSVKDQSGNEVLAKISLDQRFEKEIAQIDADFEKRRLAYLQTESERHTLEREREDGPQSPNEKDGMGGEDGQSLVPKIFFKDPDQLISPTTAYLITSLLMGVVQDRGGTGGAARALGRPVAAKTGSTSNYYDGWFVGYTPQIVTGVWVGYDEEKSLGKSEVGGKTALPIWLNYMKAAHENLPVVSFPIPQGIVFANIDNETGRLASSKTSEEVISQAFLEGTEPHQGMEMDERRKEAIDFFKEDLAE